MAAPLKFKIFIYTLIFLIVCLTSVANLYNYDSNHNQNKARFRAKVESMFYHAYDSYLNYAYPLDELRPLSCDGQDTWGSFSLTLVDSLDTLAVMGNYSEFRRVSNLLIKTLDFDRDINVSVFETNIRVVGGLISAHLMSHKAGLDLDPGWPCSGPLLTLAENLARKILPAFDTPTGMPYGTVNLRYGVPRNETPVTCTAGVGTFIVEFGALSRLTGDSVFERAAKRAMTALWDAKSDIGLVGNHIDVLTGRWTAVDAGIGAGVDSYFEYLVKGATMFSLTEYMHMFKQYSAAFEKVLKKEDWYMWAHMKKGSLTLPVFQSLEAFWPGVQSMVGDIEKGLKSLHNYHQVWSQYGFTPEFYNIPKNEIHGAREGYPLRPELIESTMYLYRATKDPYLLQVGIDIFESIEENSRTNCGYATVQNVQDHRLTNRMESFFLAETTKYLYLLFSDDDHFIHNTGGKGTVINSTHGECVIDAGGYVFNTEAHPIDTAALYCCSADKQRDDLTLIDLHNNLDLLDLFDLIPTDEDYITKPKDNYFDEHDIDEIYNELNMEWKPVSGKMAETTPASVILPNKDEKVDQSATVPKSVNQKAEQSTVDTILSALSNTLEMFQMNTEPTLQIKEAAPRKPAHRSVHVHGGVPLVPKNTLHKGGKGDTKDKGPPTCALPGQTHDHVNSPYCVPSESKEHSKKIINELTWKYTTLMSCPALPYYMKYSIMGEFFDSQPHL